MPAVRDCINARAKRTLKQLFPVNMKHVNAVASDGKIPYTQLSLLEHYIRKLKLKSIVRSDLVAGDVTGQWCLAIDWTSSKRSVRNLVRRNPLVEQIDGEDVADLGIEDPLGDESEELEEEDVIEEGPDVVDFAVEDLAVVPPTVSNLQRATAVSLRLRLSKERVQEMVDEGAFILPDDTDIADFCEASVGANKVGGVRNRAKKQVEDAGIKTEGTDKHALIFMAYAKLPLEEGKPLQSAVIFYAGPDEIVGILRNPLWSAKIPIISEPVERLKGSFFGKSKIEAVKFLQWDLVDFWNMGQDSAMYTLLPIFKADPLKTPNWQSLVMGLAAIWPIAPNDLDTVKMPQLWKDADQRCESIKRQIWQSLDVNEMMMGVTPSGRKNNAMIGSMKEEQSTNITDNAERYEQVVLTPLAEFLFEFDQQFRTEAVTIEQRGEIGVKAKVEEIPPQQWGEKIYFSWAGTAYLASMQRMQQQIAWMNVVKGIPPQMLNGRKLDVTPIIEMGTENIFGPELAPRILVDERNMFTVDPDTENEILHNGITVMVHEADDDTKHLQAHMKAAATAGDPAGLFKSHMAMHMQALQAKQQKQMAAQQGAPGGPGGAGPGVAGTPRPGAQPAPQRPGGQQPPGAIQQDNMEGAPGRG